LNDLELCYEQCRKNKKFLKMIDVERKRYDTYYKKCRYDCRQKGIPRIVLWSDYYVYG